VSPVDHKADIKLPNNQTSVHHFYWLLGDVAGDGIVDVNDLNEIAADMGESSPVGWTPFSADVTGAGSVTTIDLTIPLDRNDRVSGTHADRLCGAHLGRSDGCS
jgi:hypothetical protein